MIIKHRKLFVVILAVCLCVLAFIVYVNDFYRADSEAIAAFAEGADVRSEILADGIIAFIPEKAESAIIFYPGGKVEYTAYVPLMQACAQQGILSVLVEMPFNLAVLDTDAAEGIQKNFPEIESWYIGGHSLGGSMAASYLADNADDYSGLVLLGAYSTADLSRSGLKVLSIYGSEDTVMNRQNYDENLSKLPADFTELIIDGGNHAGFGMYGIQEGDGEAEISAAEQIRVSAAAIAEFMK